MTEGVVRSGVRRGGRDGDRCGRAVGLAEMSASVDRGEEHSTGQLVRVVRHCNWFHGMGCGVEQYGAIEAGLTDVDVQVDKGSDTWGAEGGKQIRRDLGHTIEKSVRVLKQIGTGTRGA